MTENTPVEDNETTLPADRSEERAEAAEKVKPPQSEADEARAFDVEEYMRDVIDPELGINVVDLGLVYDIWIENGDEAVIEMTLTSPACPLTDVLEDQAEQAVVGNKVASKLTIKWVWMPPWTPAMITEDGREQLRALGFSV
ncbi:aromatic ring hydroxylase [Corynebacterium sp. 13CS0277]|uniref:metal-sulfur cluster assembly factor n=1 Tax=Corynebacterium sp. 13CS0277 TaxID=2071994 RepID=UPI000D03903C|nr:metal-sulfur cluster assembly factor [Corynebacterium sp. 13CS0277]PRQ11904.1 aromatic ring hydroxylase [Corynebacterium sp. 13CS0277]